MGRIQVTGSGTSSGNLADVAISGSYADLQDKPIVIIGAADPIPPGTAAGTVILRRP